MSVVERNAGREMLDAKPLQALIKRDIERCGFRSVALRSRLGESLETTERILRRVPNQQRVSLSIADAYCTRMGHGLAVTYPALYDEAS